MSAPTAKPSKASHSARERALAVLLAAQKSDDPIDEILDRLWIVEKADPRDRGLAMELIYGVLRRRETIDWRLGPVLKKPLPRIPLMVQFILRLGAYQLLYMDRVPTSAAVNESVNLAKRHATKLGRDWSGLVNAVLRALITASEPALPDGGQQPARSLSIRYAVPLWLCERWIAHSGVEAAEAACKTVSAIPAVTLRVNRLRISRDEVRARFKQAGLVARPTTISPAGVVVEEGPPVTSLPGFAEGWWYVEDEAAQLIPLLLDPQPGEQILDACAAPGGKTTHLAELMKNRGQIVAMDRQAVRLDRLKENAQRLGVTIIISRVGDVREPRLPATGKTVDPICSVPESFDRILVDAPCSGIGVLRRHPEAKRKKHQAMFSRHHNLQKKILEAVAAALRPGGVLVYSTCSTEREETEDVVEHFCRARPGWMRESVAPWLPSTALPFVTAHGALSTMGNTFGMDGFYAARLRKVS
jgi:16S rRNA (cytosine967-C5)-methyltransferase